MTLEAYLAEIRKRLADATPGKWEVRYRELDNHEQAKVWAENYGWLITKGELPRAYHEPSMELIASAPADLARLVKIIEVQWQALECDQREHLAATAGKRL